jgi:pilus assembly protein Flp/PilA
MNNLMLKMFVTLKTLMSCEEGQDLVEYALVVALIALGAVAAMQALSTQISTIFGTIQTKLAAA